MKRRPDQHPTMADIVAEAKVESARAARERVAAEAAREPRRQWIDDDLFTVSDDEITAEEALRIALESRLVVWDACGCGGWCDYEVWEGSEVRELIDAGRPVVQDGSLRRIEGDEDQIGVLVEGEVRWGALR